MSLGTAPATRPEVKQSSSISYLIVGVLAALAVFLVLIYTVLSDWWRGSWLFLMLFNPTTSLQKIVVMIFAIVLFVAVMGVILWAIDRPQVPNWLVAFGFLAPVVVFLAVGLVWPALKTIYDSFQKFNGVSLDSQGFAGFDNYTYYFTAAQSNLFINTVLWVFLVPIIATVFGLVYAVLVDRTRFEAAAKALIFLPTAISMVAAAVIWRYVYYQPAPKGKDEIGLLNATLNIFGADAKNWLVLGFPVPTLAMIAIMIWIQAGFAMTVLSASIKAVPDDIIEAAKIDGATGMKLFTKITIPSIRPTLVVVITTVAFAALKSFDIVNVMSNRLPASQILASQFFNELSGLQYGRAGALAVMIFVIVSPVIVFNIRQMKKSEEMR